MRKTAVAIALVLVATLGIIVPSVGGRDRRSEGRDHRRRDARRDRELSRECRPRPTPRRSSTPRTSSRSTARTRPGRRSRPPSVGARVVIYMGHGNGWPSPYTYDPAYTTKNGFGLNATSGAGDYNNKYYGEPYVSTLDLAPGAIVLLHHLCYAVGQLRAGRRRADRVGRPPARRQLRRGLPEGGRRRRSSPTATPGPRATCGRCSRPTSRSRTCGGRCRTPTATSCRSRRRGRRARPSSRIPTRRRPGSTDRSRSDRDVTTDEVVAGGYGDTGADPAEPRRARATPPSRRTAPACTASRDTTGRRRLPTLAGRDPPPRRRSARPDHRRRARRSSRSRASTTRRSPASCWPPTSPPRDSTCADRPRPRHRRPVLAQRRSATR